MHCPLTSIRYGSALESFARYRDAGVNIALGTDSFPPDLIRGMDVGSNVAKIVDGRLDAAGAAAYVRAGTLNGAKALRRDDLGRIAVGATADLVAFPLDDVRDGVIEDPVRTLLYNSNARQTRLSMVGGRVVVRDGAIDGVDVAGGARARPGDLRPPAGGLLRSGPAPPSVRGAVPAELPRLRDVGRLTAGHGQAEGAVGRTVCLTGRCAGWLSGGGCGRTHGSSDSRGGPEAGQAESAVGRTVCLTGRCAAVAVRRRVRWGARSV